MAIRDALAIDLDEAKITPVKKKGKLKYVKPEPSEPSSRGQQVMTIAAVLFVVFLFMMMILFMPKKTEGGVSLELKPDRPSYGLGQTINIDVQLVNKGSSGRAFALPTPQKYKLSILNESGQIVSEYTPTMIQVTSSLTISAGERQTLGTYFWNQTVRSFNGTDEVYTPVPAGTYTVKASFTGDSTISAEKKLLIV